MKKPLLILIVLFSYVLHAQEEESLNQWSIDIGLGLNSALSPFATGFSSPAIGVWQGSIGARYMFNEKHGVKLSFGYSSIKNDSNSITSFETAYYGGNVEWVLNAGNLLNFQ